ncbi:MAG TPA: hypothetical protein VM010_07525 [Chitinophagaceae bacterium]|nr:hypothetical protein [Chitinophagaceae bacterium]
MKNLKQPSFITFVNGAVLVFIGIGINSNGGASGSALLLSGLALMGIFWIWSIAKVVSAPDLKPYQKRFWMISVIAVQVLGGLVFHIMHQQPGKITT